MRAPFPYFGGKSRIAATVWRRLGDTPNYVEPFAGSAVVLLARPDVHCWWDRIETINDADGLLCNLYRAIQADPAAVAHHADWPVSECDLHARHAWLVGTRDSITAKIEGDPYWYDAHAAGWWLWGICSWIGSGWCSGDGPWIVEDDTLINGSAGQGIHRKLPHLGDGGRGIHRQRPHLGTGEGHGEVWSVHLADTMQQLADRLRRVRICCGDWSRVLTDAVTIRHGVTAVFLDPPYALSEREGNLYACDGDVSGAVREWAIAHGDDARFRIALCGYDGEHVMPEDWSTVRWKTQGGYGGQGNGRGRDNAQREVVWFSPHCLVPTHQPDLFSLAGVSV